jgi:protein TonB
MAGQIIKRVDPVYPPDVRVQGAVILRAIVSKTGDVENLQVISGPPMLTGAALDAVKQWKYKPYLLNGEPLEVETVINVNFILATPPGDAPAEPK